MHSACVAAPLPTTCPSADTSTRHWHTLTTIAPKRRLPVPACGVGLSAGQRGEQRNCSVQTDRLFTVPRPSTVIPTFLYPTILTGIPGEILTGPAGEILTGIPGAILTGPPGEIRTGPAGDSDGHSRRVTDWSLHYCSSRPSQSESVVSSDCNLLASSRGHKRQT